jgi:hypothetical protein
LHLGEGVLITSGDALLGSVKLLAIASSFEAFIEFVTTGCEAM